jgi:hypothetical protein
MHGILGKLRNFVRRNSVGANTFPCTSKVGFASKDGDILQFPGDLWIDHNAFKHSARDFGARSLIIVQ